MLAHLKINKTTTFCEEVTKNVTVVNQRATKCAEVAAVTRDSVMESRSDYNGGEEWLISIVALIDISLMHIDNKEKEWVRAAA